MHRRVAAKNPLSHSRAAGFESHEPQPRWRRAYREINEFERMLVDSGIRVVKLFLHITPDEQVRRFRGRRSSETLETVL
jgi:polyphosphate kinase 2 (PPK2 family)